MHITAIDSHEMELSPQIEGVPHAHVKRYGDMIVLDRSQLGEMRCCRPAR